MQPGANARSVLLCALLASSANGRATAAAPPWETWKDLHRLPVLHAGHQSLLRSSHCLDGCRFDRHSTGDSRYLYVDGDEGVIFEESGAGAISRIWMTMGAGTSVPLDPSIRIRIYVDGDADPVIDLPIPSLFDGSAPPFLPPLVGDRSSSSGGNFSYVPIPYVDGCKVALVGADEQRIWFQINFHRLADTDGIVTFSGSEDLSAFSDLLTGAGQDPWLPAIGTLASGELSMVPGETRTLLAIDGPGSLNAIRLGVTPSFWDELYLSLVFDGEATVEMPIADFFAIGRGGALPTRSLFVGVAEGGSLYSYFPMPFFESAEVGISHRGVAPSIEIAYMIRLVLAAPPPGSGLFGATTSETAATRIGRDFAVLDLSGEGKIAGSFLELGSTDGPSRQYLEGDERFFIDGSEHPAVYGTGVEDYFNGGFYFDMGPFSNALHGAPYVDLEVGGLPTTAAYRIFLSDGITFANRLEAGLEGGPTGDVSMKAKAVTYFYRRRQPRIHLWDRFEVGSPAQRQKHLYQVDGAHLFQDLDAKFEGEPPRSAVGRGVYRPPGEASFTMRAHPTTTRIRLRRRLDASHPGQRATVFVNGVEAGSFPPVYANTDRRWRELDIDLDVELADEDVMITVVAEPPPVATHDDTFTAFRYELWGNGAAAIFADGFESGDLSSWSSQPP